MITLSIVMSTYNGEKYILEQLQSIYDQTSRPDEVIIRDDGSSDATVSLCKAFIQDHSMLGWRVICNEENLGWAENFSEGFLQAHGDIIFPCDQDDIWESTKIERMKAIMNDRPEINLLVGSFRKLIQDDDGYTRIEAPKFTGQIKKIPFDEKVIFIDYPGCVFCFRKTWYDEIRKYRFPDYPHDALLLRMGKLTDSAYLWDEPVIRWRRHTSNATGRPVRTNDEMSSRIDYYINCLEQMKAYCREHGEGREKTKLLDKNIEFYRIRGDAFKHKQLLGSHGLIRCLKYLAYYPRPISILGDAYRIMH